MNQMHHTKKPYLVVAAKHRSNPPRKNPQRCYPPVLMIASNYAEACERAREASEKGHTLVVAFSRKLVLKMAGKFLRQ